MARPTYRWLPKLYAKEDLKKNRSIETPIKVEIELYIVKELQLLWSHIPLLNKLCKTYSIWCELQKYINFITYK
uniref:Uncharacterized protein n=1 Tax=Physcomitrium patens TaxID=3218 RepID=A0A2K1L2T6_PHYPA|nr:hypothetical protein PHYPA_003126 [Physcomitrium patens]